MKSKLPLFALILFLAACDEQEGSDLPSPCEVDTPVIHFEYEPGKVTLRWDDMGDFYYNLNYLVKSAPDEFYSRGTSADTFAIIRSFHPGTTYEAELSVSKGDIPTALNRCNGAIELQSFTPPCAPYTSLDIADITATTATIIWDKAAEPAGKAFTVNLRKKGTTDISTNSTDSESLKLSSLSAKTTYEVQLAFTCTDNAVYVSDWFEFATL